MLDRKSIFKWVTEATRLRSSPRLYACVDILHFFLPMGSFARRDVLGDRSGLCERYNAKALSRAIKELNDCGILQKEGKLQAMGGGAIYRIRPYSVPHP